MKVLFIRHAETDVNAKGIMHKTNDTIGLSENGKEQAKALISVCRREKVEYIFSSYEERANETASIICDGIGASHKIIRGFEERNWGDWEGRPWEEVKSVLDKMSIYKRYTFIPPNGESWEQMNVRLKRTFDEAISSDYDTIAIISHAGALRALISMLKNEPKENSFQYDFKNALVSIFDINANKITEILLDDVSHLAPIIY